MKKYFGWMFAITTAMSLSLFANDADEATYQDDADDQVAVTTQLEEVEDSDSE